MNEIKKIKVVQINTLGKTLSTGRTTREMHDYFQENGIESYIACPAPLDCDDVFFFSTRNLMRIDTALQMLTGLAEHQSSLPTKKLIRFIDEVKADIVHLRILHSNCVNLHMLLGYLAKKNIATVITLHDFWFLTGKCCFYTEITCDKWRTGCYNCQKPQIKKRPVLFDRSKKMWLDKKRDLSAISKLAFVGVSDWVVEEALKSPMCQDKIVKRIYNWVDLDCFFPHEATYLRERYCLKYKFIILGVAAAWVSKDRKGLDVYLKLAKKLPQNYTIILIGQMSENLDLPENIISVGRIEKKSLLSDFYAMADVYLNLSSAETFGKVSAEALSCGTPIVAIDATANKELVPYGCGVVIKEMKISEILKALKEIYTKTKNYYSENCRVFACQNFCMKQNITKYIELYKQLIQLEHPRSN